MKLKVHSGNKIIDYESQYREWKIQLTIQIKFAFSADSGETRTIHTKSENVEIMMRSETNDII